MKDHKRRQQALREARRVLNRGFSFQPCPAEDGTILPALSIDRESIGDAEEILEAAGYTLPQMAVVVCDVIKEMRVAVEKGLQAGPLREEVRDMEEAPAPGAGHERTVQGSLRDHDGSQNERRR